MERIAWNKSGDAWIATAGPFALRVRPKGDGRFEWHVFEGSATNPTATGVAASLGAARTATEQFAKRSGRV